MTQLAPRPQPTRPHPAAARGLRPAAARPAHPPGPHPRRGRRPRRDLGRLPLRGRARPQGALVRGARGGLRRARLEHHRPRRVPPTASCATSPDGPTRRGVCSTSPRASARASRPCGRRRRPPAPPPTRRGRGRCCSSPEQSRSDGCVPGGSSGRRGSVGALRPHPSRASLVARSTTWSTTPNSTACAAVSTLSRSVSRRSCVDRAPGVVAQHLLDLGAHAQQLVGLQREVADRPLPARGRLVQQHPGVPQREAASRLPRREEHRRGGCRLPEAVRRDRAPARTASCRRRP